jgi:hypothetical protein
VISEHPEPAGCHRIPIGEPFKLYREAAEELKLCADILNAIDGPEQLHYVRDLAARKLIDVGALIKVMALALERT